MMDAADDHSIYYCYPTFFKLDVHNKYSEGKKYNKIKCNNNNDNFSI